MQNVVSLTAYRKERLKAKLQAFAERREPAVIETRSGVITAMRVFCREAMVVLIDKFGCQAMLHYDQITGASAVLPAAQIVDKFGWQVAAAPNQGRILEFPRASRRA